jgi:SpoIID/LytB domain protein
MPRRLALSAAIVGLGLATLGPASAALGRDGPTIVGIPPTTTFYGRGYGHGVGLSQYGARGRAIAGQTAAQILAHYYQGTTLGHREPASLVRVLILNAFAASSSAPLTIVGRASSWTIDGIAKTFAANAKLTLAPTASGASTWALRVISATGATLHAATVSTGIVVRPSASALLQLVSKPSSYDTYRGLLRIGLTTKATVVNQVGVDAYLRGVVPVEMPSSWPVEALKAQAIAARSYALYRVHPTTGTFDLYDDTRSQIYRGQEAERATTDAAITATSGTVALSGSAVVNALFHSAGGGATENNENVFVSSTGAIVAGPVSYLRGSSDRAPDGSSYDAASPYATWQTATYRLDTLGLIFGHDGRTAVGSLSRLDLSRRGVSGRLISITLIGSGGTKTVSGDVFRAVFNAWKPGADPVLRSNLFATKPIP